MTQLVLPLKDPTSASAADPTRRRVMVYLVALTVLTVLAHAAAARVRGGAGSDVASLIIMWSPGIAAIVASLLTRRSLKEIGCASGR